MQAKLHNGVAAANMRMLRWEEAETELQVRRQLWYDGSYSTPFTR